jgi:hypothetical protein
MFHWLLPTGSWLPPTGSWLPLLMSIWPPRSI